MKRYKAEYRQNAQWCVIDTTHPHPENIVRSGLPSKAEATRIARSFNNDSQSSSSQ